MKRIKFKVPLYNYSITVVHIESNKDKGELIKEFKKLGVPNELYKDSIEYVEKDYMNGGDTYRNMLNKRFLVIIYLCESENIRREIIGHEKRHVEDRILEHVGVKDLEASAYLAGYLSQYMY